MTEEEWLACTNRETIALAVERRVSDRKVQLIACGCCRLAWDCLADERSRNAVEISERFADDLATSHELGRASFLAEAAVFAVDKKAERYRLEQKAIKGGWLDAEDAVEDDFIVGQNRAPIPFKAARTIAACAQDAAFHPEVILREFPNPVLLVSVVRDVVGNPFRPVAVDPAWLTSDVLALARGIYDDRAFDRMPILADALQDAGCNNPAILNHCRSEGTHVRGCWVVDLLLGLS